MNQETNQNITALHMACIRDNDNLVTYLIEQGANVDAGRKSSYFSKPVTPVTNAITNKNAKVLDILLNAGASIVASEEPDLKEVIDRHSKMRKMRLLLKMHKEKENHKFYPKDLVKLNKNVTREIL